MGVDEAGGAGESNEWSRLGTTRPRRATTTKLTEARGGERVLALGGVCLVVGAGLVRDTTTVCPSPVALQPSRPYRLVGFFLEDLRGGLCWWERRKSGEETS